MKTSEQINELATALARAQAKIEGAVKDKSNPAFRSRYADMGAVWDACREPLSSNGLSVVQFPRTLDGAVEVETILLHASGQFLSDAFAIPVSKRDAHGYMSACTYARRAGLMAVAGIAPVDDDGNGAVGKGALMQDPIALAKAEIAAEHGDRPSQYEVDKAKKSYESATAHPMPAFLKRPVNGDPKRKKAEDWIAGALDAISRMPSERAIGDWWADKEPTIQDIETSFPDLFDRLQATVDARRDQVPIVRALP